MRRVSLALLVALPACVTAVPRTEVLVAVNAEPAVRAAAATLRVRVLGGPRDATMLVEEASQNVTPRWPTIVAIVPAGGDTSRVFEVEAIALDSSDAPIAVVRARTGFVAEKTLALDLTLEDCCRAISLTCAPDQTCRSCACSNSTVDPTSLPGFDGGVADAAVAPDASDAGSDAADAGPCGPVEVCTNSASGSPPADENCNGQVDEGCPIVAGNLHRVLDFVGQGAWLNTPWPSPDGLRVYFVDFDWAHAARLRMAVRPTLRDVFGPPTDVALAPPSAQIIVLCSLSGDELNVVCALYDPATALLSDLFEASRSTRDGAFGAMTALDTLAAVPGYGAWPSLRRDSMELFYSDHDGSGNWVVRRATRTSAASAFVPAGTATFGSISGVVALSLGSDGLHALARLSSGGALYAVHRATLDDVAFVVDGLLIDPNTSPCDRGYGYLDIERRELWVSQCAEGSSSVVWISRAEVCRDGPCPDRRPACAGTTGADGFHCYTMLSSAMSRSAAEAACAAVPGGHLATIQMPSEQTATVTTTAMGDYTWIGGTRGGPAGWGWVTGESWLAQAQNWATAPIVQPDNAGGAQDCVVVCGPAFSPPGAWADDNCSSMYPAVCETETWPTW